MLLLLVMIIGPNYRINSKAQNDIDEIMRLIQNSAGEISLPAGEFDFGGRSVRLNSFLKIYGAGKEKTVLKNLTIESGYGVELESLSLIGGKSYQLPTMGSKQVTGTVAVIINPMRDDVIVKYTNVNFSDVYFASYILGEGKIALDSAEGCTFSNIGRAAIYHSINSEKSLYENNIFKNIGNRTIKEGPVSAIWIGDVTNCTYAQSNDVVINNNTFIILNTADDDTFTSHVINANFISVRANIAEISNNIINGVVGYGEDREALYTKVKYLSITNNNIINGGYGEGYITCKGQDGEDAYANITDNKISGEYGTGIIMYGAGIIARNEIRIDNCMSGIITYGRNCLTSKNVTISDNTLYCEPGYYSKGKMLTQFTPKGMIFSGNPQCSIDINNNRLISSNRDGLWEGAINLSCVSNNITVNDNYIDFGNQKGYGIFIHADNSYAKDNNDIDIVSTNNTVVSKDSGIAIMLKNDPGINSNRKLELSNNELTTVSNDKYAIYVYKGNNNNDSINSKNNVITNSNRSIYIETNDN